MWGVLEREETEKELLQEEGMREVALAGWLWERAMEKIKGQIWRNPLLCSWPGPIHGHPVRDITGTCFLHTGEPRSPFERSCFRRRGWLPSQGLMAPEEV